MAERVAGVRCTDRRGGNNDSSSHRVRVFNVEDCGSRKRSGQGKRAERAWFDASGDLWKFIGDQFAYGKQSQDASWHGEKLFAE